MEEESIKEKITYADFSKLDLRVAKVLKAERIEGADKLLKLTVDYGQGEKTICAGIAEYYQPEEVEGRLVPVLTNLEAKTLRGVASEGMMLMVSSKEGRMNFLNPEEGAQVGDIIR